jgi:acyl dehydratase
VEGPDGTGILEASFGRCLEDFVVGDVFLHWPGRTVTEGDHQLFCLLTNNLNPIHVDRDASLRHPVFGRVVVVGTYIYALLAGMSGADVSGSAIANLGVDHLEHTAPLYPGDTLYAESEVLAARPVTGETDRGVVSVETRGWNQHDTPVCRFTRPLLVWRRQALPPRPLVGARGRTHAL